MAYEVRDFTGALFKNENKQTGDKQPDYRGNCKINGVEWSLAAWIREGKKGKYMSLSVQEPREQRPQEEEKPF